MARREYKGAAAKTRLSTNINSAVTSFDIVNAAGWPTGGANGEFYFTLDADLSTEERCRATSRTGNTLSGVTRGVDDTTAVAHDAGADGTVIHSFSADDADEANRHINDTTIDEHTQYMKTDGTRHDLTARHPGGTVVPTAVPVAIGTALAEGGGTTLAKSTHVHVIGAGTINATNMFAAGIVDAAAIGTGAVGSGELATDAVIAGKIADAAIDDQLLFSTDTQPVTVQGTDPGAIGANKFWFNTTATKRAMLVRNSGNSAWEVFQSMIGQDYTPTLSGITIGNGLNYAHYRHHGSTIIADGFVKVGTTTVVTGRIGLSLPITARNLSAMASDEMFFHGAGRATDVATGNSFGGVGVVGVGTVTFDNTKLDFIVTAGSVGWDINIPFPWSTTDRFSWFVEYEPSTLVDARYV
jgi:hypothetical protein